MTTDVGILDFTVQRGNNFTQEFTFQDDDGNAINLTGKEVVFRAMDGGGTELVRVTSADAPVAGSSSIVIDSAIGGEITLDVWFDVTRTMVTTKSYRYEIEVRDTDARQYSWLKGALIPAGDEVNDDA